MTLRPSFTRYALLIALMATVIPSRPNFAQAPRCLPSDNTPIPDLVDRYRGLLPGLYPGGRATPADSHLATGLALAVGVKPLDVLGQPSPRGHIVLLSIGMSNTGSEFGRFIEDLPRTPAVNSRLVAVNGALSGADAAIWADPDGPAWRHASAAVIGQYSPAQVQVIWMKQARRATVPFPAEAEQLAVDLDAAVRIARTTFPNLRIVYVSSRTRAGAVTRRGPGEPQAYETAFAVRRLIEKYQEPPGHAGTSWISWGPYLWANMAPRSDGLVWDCSDLEPDRLHPSDSGSAKVAQQLIAFFMAHPTAAPWFLDSSRPELQQASPRLTASASDGQAPLVVTFGTEATWPVHHYWSFSDGTTSLDAHPRKTFFRAGTFDVWVTVSDAGGRWARASTQVVVQQ